MLECRGLTVQNWTLFLMMTVVKSKFLVLHIINRLYFRSMFHLLRQTIAFDNSGILLGIIFVSKERIVTNSILGIMPLIINFP